MKMDFPPDNAANKKKESLHSRLTELALELETTKNPEVFKTLLNNFLQELELGLHLPLEEDVTTSYHEMEQEKLLLRVENISRVMESIVEHKPISVGNKEDHYANSVVPNNDGIKIAFAEGRAPGPVRILIGFDVRTAISYKPDSLQVYEVDQDEEDLRDIELRKKTCRHVVGNIEPESIKHLVIRTPRKIFPEERLTDDERNSESMYIFRALHVSKATNEK